MPIPDPAHRATDEMLESLEKRLHEIYEEAAKDIEQKTADYLKQFESEDKQWQAWVEDGKKTEKQYQRWRADQIATGTQWNEKREAMAQYMTNVDRQAMDMVNGSLPRVYAENINFATWEIESQTQIDTSFQLYSQDTVGRLLRENPDLLPSPGLAAQREIDAAAALGKDIRWNRQHIQSALIQGIIQGESIPDIAARMQQVANMDENAAIRTARTAMTGAQNAGRMDGYRRAESMGIQMRKTWVATLDKRTRDAHRELDGQTVDVDEKFVNEIGPILYPGDPSADPANIYNCRCTTIAQVKGFERDVSNTDLRHDRRLGDMTYEEWKAGKDNGD